MNKNVILVIGILLVLVGLTKPNLSLLSSVPSQMDVMELKAPDDEKLKKEANDIIVLLKKNPESKNDFKKLRNLTLDLAKLIELSGEDTVVNNTEEIRQANKIAGPMLKLDIKGKYPELAKENNDVIVAAIGDDNIVLSDDLRVKCVEAFNALAWAYNEVSK